jgi:MFS family permease
VVHLYSTMSSTIALVEFDSNTLNPSRDIPVETPSHDRDHVSVHSTISVAPRHTDLLNDQDALSPDSFPKLQGGKALVVSLQLALSTCANSFATGLITLGIVEIAADLHLNPSLVYWPVLAYNLASSPLLIPFGAIADVFGARPICLLGSLSCGMMIIACGLARNGNELIAFRCLQGVAGAMFLPTSMSILSTTLASGKIRNIALASLGLSMVVGYAAGLVLGGVLLSTLGWRVGYFMCGGLQILLFGLGLWTIPSPPKADSARIPSSPFQKLRRRMDWVGALILCGCIGMLSYVLAMIAQDVASIRQPMNASLLTLSLLLVPAFISWMRYQERRNKPALIPSSLWKTTFTTICIVVAFANAEMQCMELLASLL